MLFLFARNAKCSSIRTNLFNRMSAISAEALTNTLSHNLEIITKTTRTI
jgi:hypothetical protein